MASHPILSWISALFQSKTKLRGAGGRNPLQRIHFFLEHQEQLPAWFQSSATAMRYLSFLEPLAWEAFPERPPSHPAHEQVIPWSAFAAACLVKLEEGIPTLSTIIEVLMDREGALHWRHETTPSKNRYSRRTQRIGRTLS